ncbi:MAG: BPL-N domain-containing protein [Candidatus Electryonea clarkiae]|nr:BPL-N domain-containing protein [Candidatus Electryonea clarkiae]MDP8288580.1 BPL-N domain-containing protein [Candidatus Electryonea clarkiae]
MINHTNSFRWLITCVLAWLPLLIYTGCYGDGDNGNKPLPKTIAVYRGNGAWDTSAVAIKACLESGGRTVNYVDANDIQESLEDYGMVIIGGGNPLNIASSLGFTGRQNIVRLVESGGAYIGLGAGAYLAADSMVFRGNPAFESPLGLYHGIAKGPDDLIATLPNYTMADIELTAEPVNPLGTYSLQVLYFGGPLISIDEPANAISVGRFIVSGNQAGFLFEYGFGRVAVISVQPEIEENDSRDGSNFGQELSDTESDWFWLLTITEWVFRERL